MARKKRSRGNASNTTATVVDRMRERSVVAATASQEAGLKKATLFMNGRSQAVRLPKEFRFEGTHVYAMKEGNRVILTPVDDRMSALIALMGSSPEFPDVPREKAEPMRPEIREYFGVSD